MRIASNSRTGIIEANKTRLKCLAPDTAQLGKTAR